MSLRADTTQLIAGSLVASLYPGLGIRGDAVPSTGTHGPGLLFNDISLPGEAADEFMCRIVTAPAGTLTLYEDSSFAYTGAGGGGTYQGFKNGVSYGTGSFTIFIGTAPTIGTQPAAQTVTEGAVATFSVTASGTAPLTYQWRFNGTPVSGATSSNYARTTVLGDSGGLVSVVITNGAGSVTSSSAALTVATGVRVADPTITLRRGAWDLSLHRLAKQPREVKDVIIEMAPWFLGRADDPLSVDFTVSDPAVTAAVVLTGTRIVATLTGGVDGGSYNVSIRMSTNATPAIVREFDLAVEVMEVS